MRQARGLGVEVSISTEPNSRSSRHTLSRASSPQPRVAAAVIVVVAVLLGAEVARLTLAKEFAETRPRLAAGLAPYVPEVLVSQSMAQVGEAAGWGKAPPETAMRRLHHLIRVAPLSVEPFLVGGAIAHRGGNINRAEALLLEARRRDPRSTAARYLLADLWLRQGRISYGLVEMANLSRLLPGSSVQLAPALSEYARMPGASEQLRPVLFANPSLREPLLNALAADPDNLQLILELERSIAQSSNARSPEWQSRLLKTLIREGAYQRAYALWQRIAGFSGPRPLLFNPYFRHVAAPPPFNWNLNSSSAGVVEPADGQMRVLFYGRKDAILASQLLLLPHGSYHLSLPFSGSAAPRSLTWTLQCVPASKRLIALELGSSATAQASFEVPTADCPAQTLELRARALDAPQESDLRVGPLKLERIER